MAYLNKSDQARAAKRHYQANSELCKSRAKRHSKASALQVRTYLAEYLSTHACVDCGETDPVVLEFDHRDPKQKKLLLRNTGMVDTLWAPLNPKSPNVTSDASNAIDVKPTKSDWRYSLSRMITWRTGCGLNRHHECRWFKSSRAHAYRTLAHSKRLVQM